ncbi:MAG: DNA polymerase I, partial [Verrucomicrobiales bacterium]
KVFMFKPGRWGGNAEVLGIPEILEKWEVERPGQVIDILGLWGDASDNIPGIPGIGEKTAKKLVKAYGSVEGLIEHAGELKGKQKEKVIEFGQQGILSKKLATINREVPIEVGFEDFELGDPDETSLKNLFVEFEFNSLGKRLFGEDFRAGRGHGVVEGEGGGGGEQVALLPDLESIKTVDHEYTLVNTAAQREGLVAKLVQQKAFCFDLETSTLDARVAQVVGIAFSWKAHEAFYVAIEDPATEGAILEDFRAVFEDDSIEKVGHNLKFDVGVLAWKGFRVAGAFFDTMLAHALVEPDQKHTMDFLAEAYLGYAPMPISALIGEKNREGGQLTMLEVSKESLDEVVEYAGEAADVTWQLAEVLRPVLGEKGQQEVFYDIEGPLLPVLVGMECEGIAIDTAALKVISAQLGDRIEDLRADIFKAAGGEDFNLNSPKQLGEVLFERLKLVEKPRKTKTGQYVTNEQVLARLAPNHEIVEDILSYRAATKLKNTYVDALPEAVFEGTGRVHTTFQQLVTATGRLASSGPNLQNIPVRTEQGREVRRAFVARDEDHLILSADYSQVELRIMAELSGDEAMREAFAQRLDIHAATAARVYWVELDEVLPQMRRSAKMVNFGIIYKISAFGLAQRLGISRGEAAGIIEEYFRQYPGVEKYMARCIEEAKEKGYVETITGRRRYLRDIDSGNANVRAAAERMAINAPIQGSAADVIKIAMCRVAAALREKKLESKMLLQVHDELVFDMRREEEQTVVALVKTCMENALPMKVPLVVETGIGENWLEAH